MPHGEPGWHTLSASQQEIDEAITRLSGNEKLDAVVIIGSSEPAALFIRTAENLPNFQGTLFGTVSRVVSEDLSSLLAAHSCTQNVIISQVVPLPTVTERVGLVPQSQAAMEAAARL